MKRLKGLLILVLTLCALCLFASAAAAYALGDVDGSGEVAVEDARFALRAAVGLETYAPDSEEFLAADADFNGEIDVSDARTILRGAVGLEDLADRLPESASLTEEELESACSGKAVPLTIRYESSTVSNTNATLISSDGVAFVSYGLLHLATEVEVQNAGRRRVSVLCVDPERKLALIRISGSHPEVSVNKTNYQVGDPVFFLDTRDRLHQATILSTNTVSERYPGVDLIQIDLPYYPYQYSCEYLPLFDRFGRIIGVICKSETQSERVCQVIPVSYMLAMDTSSPRTLAQFTQDEYHFELEASFSTVEIVPYAVACIPIAIKGYKDTYVSVSIPTDAPIEYEISNPENHQCTLSVFADSRCCENVPVTLYAENLYESVETTVYVTVREDGYLNSFCFEELPDPCVLWKVRPAFRSEEFSWEDLTFTEMTRTFDKNEIKITGEEMFYSFVGVLNYMGYEYQGYEYKEPKSYYVDDGTTVDYTFTHPAWGVTILYSETKDWITVTAKRT